MAQNILAIPGMFMLNRELIFGMCFVRALTVVEILSSFVTTGDIMHIKPSNADIMHDQTYSQSSKVIFLPLHADKLLSVVFTFFFATQLG